MTEAAWRTSDDPYEMLDFVQGRLSDRKLRLFLCACCRRIWGGYADDRSRRALEAAERYAEGLATERELGVARNGALAAARRRGDSGAWGAYWAASRRLGPTARGVMEAVTESWARIAAIKAQERGISPSAAWNAAADAASHSQADLLREIIGDPLRPVRIDPAWLAWNDGVVRKMARVLHDERRFAEMPLLADALEDAGCADAELLGHLRGPGEHVPGCFALDALAGLG